MCELLVRVVDKVNSDPYLDVQCTKRGDVIAAMPNGHQWGSGEAQNADYTIVKLPALSVAKAEDVFLTPEPGDRTTDRMLQRRAVRFDLEAFAALKGKGLTEVAALALKKAVAKRVDPNVLGDNKTVIGGR